MKHLNQHQILIDCQHGFRSRRSCETQLLTLVHELSAALDKGVQHDLAVLDFSKAFDRVPHERLLIKLQFYGIRGSTLKWIRSFLTDRSQRVIVDGATSESVPVVSGVPQGSVLGPILFLLFINDLPQCVKSRTRLFADDCVIYREVKSVRDCGALQNDLIQLEKWENTWGMSFHPEKCSILRITRSRSPVNFNYQLKGHTLKTENSVKYLGVELVSNLSWSNHINKIVKKANSTLGFLRRNLRISNANIKSIAYFSLVRPNLEYCSSVWNPHTRVLNQKIEMVQRRAARFVKNKYRNTSSVSSMLEDLQWESLQSRRMKSQLTMFYKIINNLVDIPANDYLSFSGSRTRSSHCYKIRQFRVSSNTFKYSFFPRTVVLWNTLPASVAEAPCLVSFKEELSSITF